MENVFLFVSQPIADFVITTSIIELFLKGHVFACVKIILHRKSKDNNLDILPFICRYFSYSLSFFYFTVHKV